MSARAPPRLCPFFNVFGEDEIEMSSGVHEKKANGASSCN